MIQRQSFLGLAMSGGWPPRNEDHALSYVVSERQLRALVFLTEAVRTGAPEAIAANPLLSWLAGFELGTLLSARPPGAAGPPAENKSLLPQTPAHPAGSASTARSRRQDSKTSDSSMGTRMSMVDGGGGPGNGITPQPPDYSAVTSVLCTHNHVGETSC